MKTLKTLSTLSMLVLATLTTGCLGLGSLRGLSAGNDDTCEEAEQACDDFIIVMCDKVESCGGDFDSCVGGLFDGGFDCPAASSISDDPDECFEDIDAMSCDELINGDNPRSCDIDFEFDEDVCG